MITIAPSYTGISNFVRLVAESVGGRWRLRKQIIDDNRYSHGTIICIIKYSILIHKK